VVIFGARLREKKSYDCIGQIAESPLSREAILTTSVRDSGI